MFSQRKDVNVLQRNKTGNRWAKKANPQAGGTILEFLTAVGEVWMELYITESSSLWIVCSWPLPGYYILSTIRCQGAFAAYSGPNVLFNCVDLRACQSAPLKLEIILSLFVHLRYLQSDGNLPNIISLMDLSKLRVGEPPRDYMPNQSISKFIVNLDL